MMNIEQTNFQYRNPLIPLDPSNVKYIVLHHIEAEYALPKNIHQWHLDNGWSGFGYNEYIRKDGTVYIGRGDNIGAQCLNHNSESYGIALEGNFDLECNMKATQYNSLVERVKFHNLRFGGVEIVPHRQLCETACPGKYFPMAQILKDSSIIPSEIDKAINTLTYEKLIQTPSYWTVNCEVGKAVMSEYAVKLLRAIITRLGYPSTDDIVDVLVHVGVVSSPDYWTKNLEPKRYVDGDYMAKLLIRLASKF